MNWLPIQLAAAHYIGDFVLQNEWMALGKSKRFWPLFLHVLVYSSCFYWLGFWFAFITGALHYGTDYYTSRLSSAAWEQGNRRRFWLVIGADQMFHAICLWTLAEVLGA